MADSNEDNSNNNNNEEERWTCEACGCNTNQTTDRTCSICGTSSGSILRRAGGAIGYAARAGWFSRGLSASAARRVMGMDDFGDEEDMWELDDERSRLLDASRQRFLEAARAYSVVSGRVPPRRDVDPAELLAAATANASSYQPYWAHPSQIRTSSSTRSNNGNNGIEVGEGLERQNLAHLTVGAGEGRAIRAEMPLPRGETSFSSSFRGNSTNNTSNQSEDEMPRRVFGFKVAFDHPSAGDTVGADMGGSYLVGLTTSSFSAYNEQNGLKQSPFFYGIEDHGQKYEGSIHGRGASARGSRGGINYSTDVPETLMNEHSVLFGAREVVTVVCDMENRTMTFWRDDILLGNLVTNLPRSGNLYPVAVPYNCGVTVAITGLDNCPLPLLRSFATDWRKERQEKDDMVRKRLATEREILIQNGAPSPALMKVLEEIFRSNCSSDDAVNSGDVNISLPYTMAARLWYRCGLKLAKLDSLLEEAKSPFLCFKDFVNVIETVIAEDEEAIHKRQSIADPSKIEFEVGDKVELAKGYEKFGDATGGPLLPGDRGIVVELQRGPSGENRSVRVLHLGRRWWYQPQALILEKSGLVESPGAWFIRQVLRSHCYDHTTLENMSGKPINLSYLLIGETVVPISLYLDNHGEAQYSEQMLGRIVADSPALSSAVSSPCTDSTSVLVEYCSKAFAEAVGINASGIPEPEPLLETRRVKTSKLMHFWVPSVGDRLASSAGEVDDDVSHSPLKDVEPDEIVSLSVSEKIQSEINSLARFEKSGIDSVTKECRKSSAALASMFSAGLPDALQSAMSVAERQMNSLEPREDLAEKLSAIGELAQSIADQLFCDDKVSLPLKDEMDTESESSGHPTTSHNSNPEQNLPLQNYRGGYSMDSRHDLRAREEERAAEISSLQQRRNMLLSLMSRAGRRSNASAFLNEMAEMGADPLARSLAMEQLAPMRGVHHPFVFGPPEDLLESNWDAAFSANQLDADDMDVEEEEEQEEDEVQINNLHSYLDKILRCRVEAYTQAGVTPSKPSGAAFSSFVRHLISGALLPNSSRWARALVDAHCKKLQLGSTQKSSSLLRGVVDEEGTPLLFLAVSLGCSKDIVNNLIGWGATVRSDEIKKAALTGQARSLSTLLQHSSYEEGMIDVEKCTPEVADVLFLTQSRQKELDRRMREAAGSFIVQLLRKLFTLLLLARRIQNNSCSKVICEKLVGNVLLRALQRAQKDASDSSPEAADDPADRSGRLPVEKTPCGTSLSSEGLLASLPRELLGDCIFDGDGYISAFLLVVEDYLCSKDFSDTASGLTLLKILLTKFPQLRSCTEIQRFGISDFISYHSILVSNRIADILSKQLTTIDVSSTEGERQGSSPSLPNSSQRSGCGTILCPKKHVCVLHITRHSSFRCDLCGNGVDRGRAMHGCRECDWDACEACTDKLESGIVKCTAISELAAECSRLLTEEGNEKEAKCKIGKDVGITFVFNSSSELDEICRRLVAHDTTSLRDLGNLLNESGRVTVHQFIDKVLPALRASLLGVACGGDENATQVGSTHRKKKARVLGSSGDLCIATSEFCREAFRLMVLESNKKSSERDAAKPGETLTPSLSERKIEVTSDNCLVDISYSDGASEILRRIHQVLSLYENVQLISFSDKMLESSSVRAMQSLSKPIEVQLSPSTFNGNDHVSSHNRSVIYAEPVIPFIDLQLHVLRAFKVNSPLYIAYCHSLVSDSAIIVERAANNTETTWQVARVMDYDEKTGGHRIRYASGWKRGQENQSIFVSGKSAEDLAPLRFLGPEVMLKLSAREYYILSRSRSRTADKSSFSSTSIQQHDPADSIDSDSRGGTPDEGLVRAFGSRVESNCDEDGTWKVYTLLGTSFDAESDDGPRYTLVSDDGILYSRVSLEQIRGYESILDDNSIGRARRSLRSARDETGIFPFFARHRSEQARGDPDSCPKRSLRRTWSALSLIDSMKPVDLEIKKEAKISGEAENPLGISFSCRFENSIFRIVIGNDVERPPSLNVLFSLHSKLPCVDLMQSSSDKTLIKALKELHERQDRWTEWPPKPSCQLFFSVQTKMAESSFSSEISATESKVPAIDTISESESWPLGQGGRSRKLSVQSLNSDDIEDEKIIHSLCDGIDETCVQCMEVIRIFSECADDKASVKDKDVLHLPGFENPLLSKKLIEQLDDPVCVVGGALPRWCIVAPSFAPRVFSYDSRRLLLERAAFGVSRSTLKQQEAKVSVGRLRQRMQSLRARAVELVGEAFSGGAEDPTALQLQADELYGMEEALATRVRAAFRAANWQEHGLNVAKAAVRRDRLLADASAVMEQYASDSMARHRRLEVRFEGESGFDAASGTEAGVTRGFFADVAEALLSADLVAGINCSSVCSVNLPAASMKDDPHDGSDEMEKEASKLPLWIPDMDSSLAVVIPTPRADKQSAVGVFPKPIPPYHPQMPDVLRHFRFMGRLFAAAIRDGFMFPLPLSSAFIKLVQHGRKSTPKVAGWSTSSCQTPLLTSADLPRPGFLGGEIFAADHYICKILDELDSSDPPLSRSELKRRYDKLATDKNFARIAFGKSYDCSFDEYFQDRTFVDPLDPSQGIDAVPLCAKGHLKSVTLYNVREWVSLAKSFMLHDGVIEQALAFREGVEDFFPIDFLRIFTAEELQREVCGIGDDVDNWDESAVRRLFKLDGGKGAAEALVAVAAIGGEGGAALSRRFGPTSPTIGFLVKSLLQASPKQRRQFLSFVTSVPIVTPGKIEVVPMVSPSGEFLPMNDPSCLPRANTCARRLYLPKFETFETFSEVLWAVVREESRFKGFYEWRGS